MICGWFTVSSGQRADDVKVTDDPQGHKSNIYMKHSTGLKTQMKHRLFHNYLHSISGAYVTSLKPLT